jgi:hypothetical protein
MSNRPDLSDYLAHFTTARAPLVADDKNNPTSKFAGLTSFDRLVSILQQKSVSASTLPWRSGRAVCFTECPWSSLMAHANQYSPYGIGFRKPHVFAAGGGPVYYVRADHFEKQVWSPHVRTFATPFWPDYRPEPLKDPMYLSGTSVDYSHEREWRVPHDFSFRLDQVEFVTVNTYEDMAKFPKDLKDAIGRDRFLIMEIYRTIERLWPVHNL